MLPVLHLPARTPCLAWACAPTRLTTATATSRRISLLRGPLLPAAPSLQLARAHAHAHPHAHAYALVPRSLLAHNPLEEHEPPEGGGGGSGSGPGQDGDPDRNRKAGKGEKEEDLSDREWDLRVGHAIHHLRTTLPTFFQTGLLVHPLPFVGPPSEQPGVGGVDMNVNVNVNTSGRAVYSPTVRLSYTPPFPLPAPFPRTLHIEGLTLYTASASIVRATMLAFHHDLSVELRRMYVHSHGRRERAARLLLTVSGFGRVTDARSEWDVNCTYTFSPTTGLISHHRIESIDPAPHISVYEGLKTSLARFLRGSEEDADGVPVPKRAFQPAPEGAGSACGGRRGGRE